jgi:hypothetical protein
MKKIINIISIFLVLILASCNNKEEVNQRWVRKEIHSEAAKKDVLALEKALRIMRQKDCSEPISWYYQGAMHWIPDTVQNNQHCQFYHTYLDKKEGWDNCTHTPSGQEEIHFLVWHRLYIYHFEKIVRKVSGYKDFALPYWGYTNSDPSLKVLQKSFRDKKSALYEPCRFDSLNSGQPIWGEIERSLDLTQLMSYDNYALFCHNIDKAPHGAMHDYIGGGNSWNEGKLKFNNHITGTITETGLMGWVPTAAFDPVFWTHHSNIDRIWQQWTNSQNGKMITLEELKSVPWDYVFFDENGKKVVYTPEEIMEIIYTMDYDYDDCKVKPKKQNLVVKSTKKEVIGKIEPNVFAKSRVTDLGTIVNKIESSAILEIDVTFTDVPDGVYEVYCNNGLNDRHPSSDNFVGFMTFFGQDHKMQGEGCKAGCCRKLKSGRPVLTFKFDCDGKWNLAKTSFEYNIELYKFNGHHSGDLRIEEIRLIKK